MKKKIVVLVTVVFLACSLTCLAATTSDKYYGDLWTWVVMADNDSLNKIKASEDAVNNPEMLKAIVKLVNEKHEYVGTETLYKSVILHQNQKLIEQNNRIIELLEKIADNKSKQK